jgi:hypothetical protein
MFAQQPTISANHPFAARFGHQTYLATKLTLDFSLDPQYQFDRRLGIAAGILLCAIEGKQDSN